MSFFDTVDFDALRRDQLLDARIAASLPLPEQVAAEAEAYMNAVLAGASGGNIVPFRQRAKRPVREPERCTDEDLRRWSLDLEPGQAIAPDGMIQDAAKPHPITGRMDWHWTDPLSETAESIQLAALAPSLNIEPPTTIAQPVEIIAPETAETTDALPILKTAKKAPPTSTYDGAFVKARAARDTCEQLLQNLGPDHPDVIDAHVDWAFAEKNLTHARKIADTPAIQKRDAVEAWRQGNREEYNATRRKRAKPNAKLSGMTPEQVAAHKREVNRAKQARHRAKVKQRAAQ